MTEAVDAEVFQRRLWHMFPHAFGKVMSVPQLGEEVADEAKLLCGGYEGYAEAGDCGERRWEVWGSASSVAIA
jgi:hypothetical protein